MNLPSPLPPGSPSHDAGAVELVHERVQIDSTVKRVLDALTRHGYTESSKFAVRLALEEGLANAFRHGHKGLGESTPVRFAYDVGPKELRVTISDRGPGFDPGAVPDPTLDSNLELPSGRGLMLMRAYMSSVTFNAKGNEVTMVYRKPAGRK
jgi:serine/threonine-protein kinase RsbW